MTILLVEALALLKWKLINITVRLNQNKEKAITIDLTSVSKKCHVVLYGICDFYFLKIFPWLQEVLHESHPEVSPPWVSFSMSSRAKSEMAGHSITLLFDMMFSLDLPE